MLRPSKAKSDFHQILNYGKVIHIMVLAIEKSRLMNQSVLKEINPEYSLEGPTPRAPALWPPDVNSQLIRKDFDVGKD